MYVREDLIGMKKNDNRLVLIYLLVDTIKIIVGIVSNILRFLVDGYTWFHIVNLTNLNMLSYVTHLL